MRCRRSPRGETPTWSCSARPTMPRSVPSRPGASPSICSRAPGCRLIIAPKGYAESDHSGDRLRVLAVGYDGMAESQAALDEAAVLARKFGPSMKVDRRRDPGPGDRGRRRRPGGRRRPAPTSRARLHDAVAGLPSELRALPVLEKGDPVHKLLEAAEVGVDLLVLGSRGFGPVMRLLIGSVSSRVIRAAPCPVMVVPRPGLDLPHPRDRRTPTMPRGPSHPNQTVAPYGM